MAVKLMVNLDYYCMKYGQQISKLDKIEKNVLRNALGILKEDGVYAMFLWLEDKDKRIRKEGLGKLLSDRAIKELFIQNNSNNIKVNGDDFRQFSLNLQNIASDINQLFLLKKLLERTLVYALYHVKVGAGE